ncbi:hypothetical protein [Prosthecomicrobium hirschii]|uniref:hypothetical protein n=1 Tax=Prosthecodimorpha hirschii TaxID=665126 RepID=UPI00221FD4C0|nr:hypothetical protein [Prosthecomicrobium hirschii]MCW1841776.1 hypothetical protein [Prosthecomicrobium hirschii]
MQYLAAGPVGVAANALHSLISQAVERLPGRSEERRLNAATAMVTVSIEYEPVDTSLFRKGKHPADHPDVRI